MSWTVALVAGVLATLSPCGFAMLPAFLSFYIGADEQDLPRASTRALQGVLVGLLVTAGFVIAFAALAVPIALGAGQLSAALPWIGFALGVIMAAVAVATLAGWRIPDWRITLPATRTRARPRERRRGAGSMVLFGAGYGVASLSCTLPLFLVVIGSALTPGSGTAGVLAAVAAYTVGIAAVLIALSVGAAFVRDGAVRLLGRLLPYLRWINGGLLAVVAVYLLYLWGTTLFAPTVRNRDLLLAAIDTAVTDIQQWLANDGAWILVAVAAAIAAVTALHRWARAATDTATPDAPDSNATDECGCMLITPALSQSSAPPLDR